MLKQGVPSLKNLMALTSSGDSFAGSPYGKGMLVQEREWLTSPS